MAVPHPGTFNAYGGEFHRLGALRAARSAEVVVPLVARWLAPRSVVDVGCGAGAWLGAWKRNGVAEVLGIDQELVDRSALRIEERELRVLDLAAPIELGRRFDLAQSLEVAEHLPPRSAAGFVEALTELAPCVLFSAAMPGQMGDHHVNEQPPGYWRALFEARGYALFDPLRPLLRGDRRVRSWYRYNLLLFAREDAARELPREVQERRVPVASPVADFRPGAVRLAMAAGSLVPRPVVQWLASGERLLRRRLARLRPR